MEANNALRSLEAKFAILDCLVAVTTLWRVIAAGSLVHGQTSCTCLMFLHRVHAGSWRSNVAGRLSKRPC